MSTRSLDQAQELTMGTITRLHRAGRIWRAKDKRMVDTGVDVYLAFPLPSSRGTRNCMRLAREAGVPILTYEQSGTPRD